MKKVKFDNEIRAPVIYYLYTLQQKEIAIHMQNKGEGPIYIQQGRDRLTDVNDYIVILGTI